MFQGNIKIAVAAIRSSRWRSMLTTLGIVIGIVSVVTTVSLGEGIKRQVVGQINRLGSDLIIVRPGKTVSRDASGNIQHINLSSSYGFGSGSLVEKDIETIGKTSGVKDYSPISLVTGVPKHESDTYNSGIVLGANASIFDILGQKIEFGGAFTQDEEHRNAAVIGKRVAEQLLKENVPIGLTINIRGEEFVVRGIFDEFTSSPLNLGTDLNKAIIIPYPMSKQLMAGNNQLVQVLVRPADSKKSKETIGAINQNLLDQHQGQDDFTVLRQDENLTVTSDVLNILTAFISGIAAISLLVGGIGIMNIMLVSVTERTREIGIRKALGATNRQILGQFLVEATALSVSGGIVGVIVAVVTNIIIRLSTNLRPVITWEIVVVATLVSVAVGIIFGITPAVKAARKDPIEALRYE